MHFHIDPTNHQNVEIQFRQSAKTLAITYADIIETSESL